MLTDFLIRIFLVWNLPGKSNPKYDERYIIHRPASEKEFVSGPPRYHLAIKGVREQFVVLEQSSGF